MSASIRRELRVRCSVERAFTVFTARIDLWWPHSHRRFEESELHLECRAGGRLFERSAAGEEHELGEVLIWEPPGRLTYSWWPGAVDGPTQVDVEFAPDGDHTRVQVLHREADTTAWAERVALFERSWTTVLDAYARFLATD